MASPNKPRWLVVAEREVGVRETPGPRSTPRVLEYHQATALHATDDAVPWCAAFVGWVLTQSNIPPTGQANARSYLAWGVPCGVLPGAVVVLKRGTSRWQGHVGFVVGSDAMRVRVLGGNQGDAVSVLWFPRAKVLGCRWPKGEPMNWIEKHMANYAINRIEGHIMQSGWKGKLGALGVGLGVVAAAFNDVANGGFTMEKAIGYWSGLMAALAAFGIRDAIGKPAK